MFFTYPQDFKERKLASGTVQRLVWGERVTLVHTTFTPNLKGPVHSHPEEQAGIVIEGEVTITIGNETQLCKKGDAFSIPGNMEHRVLNGGMTTVVIQSFCPPLKEFK